MKRFEFKNRIASCALALAAFALFAFPVQLSAQSTQPEVFFASQIWNGKDAPVKNAAMVVVDGKIVEVGPRADVSIPPGAKRHELGGQVIIPGLIASHTNLSGSTTEERTLTPEVHALDGFDFFADRVDLLKSGITTAQISPGINRLMPGVGGVVQIGGDDITERILKEEESLRIILTASSRNPPRIYEPPVGPVSEDRPLKQTRPQLSTLTASLAGLRQIFRQATANETFVSDEEPDPIVTTVAELVKKRVPLRISASTAPEIRGAISLAKEFDQQIILVDCVGLEPFVKVFDQWKKHVKGVILSGSTPGTISNPSIDQIEQQTEKWEYARELMDAGIPVAIRSSDANLSRLMFIAGQFMQDDLSAQELLASLTSTPAKLMGVDKSVGSLEKGKRADFLVLNGVPFHLHSRIVATYAGGAAAFERPPEAKTMVVTADKVYVGNGHYLDNANVVIKGKTVRGVGSSVSSPANSNFKKFNDGAVIVPGFVDMGAQLGLGGPLSGSLTLSTKLGEQLYGDDPAIAYARKNGITTALLSTTTGNGSPVVAFKLGDDTRVISDPIAIKFRLDGNTASGISTNERLLKAGKAYVDSWAKYEKDLAEYEVKKKAADAEAAKKKPAETKKPEPKKEAEKKEADKKEADKKKVEKKPEDKKEEENKDKPEDKKEKVLPDPITGTWEGEIDNERLPPTLKAMKFELVLKDKEVTGTIEAMRGKSEITEGSYDRDSKELKVTFERRSTELTLKGKIGDDGELSGTFGPGRGTPLPFTAKRTVDKSKKPTPKPKEEPKPKPGDKPKPKPEDKPKPGEKDKPKPDEKDKPKEGDKKEADKEAEKKEADKKEADKKAAEKKEADKKPALKAPKKPRLSTAMEPYKDLFAGKIPAIVESRNLYSIKAAAELFAKKYKVRLILIGADDLAREPDMLADYDVSVLAGPSFSVTVDKEPPTNMPQLFANERLPFGFQSGGTTGAGKLPSAVQYVVSQGLSTDDALQALTSGPAKMLSEDSKFGTIKPGNDADLVVLSGPPFEFSTKVLAVMIDGEWVYEREEQK